MAYVQSLDICQTSEEGLTPSYLLEQSCEHLASEMSQPSLSHLGDHHAACLPELFQFSDQTRDIKPVNMSDFYSGHQEAMHGHILSIPTPPSIGDPCPCLPRPPSESVPAPHQPHVTFHLTPAYTPHFIWIPKPKHTSSHLNINYTSLQANHSSPMHHAIPPYPFTPSRTVPSQLRVLNSKPAVHQPMNAEPPSQSLDRDPSWHTHMMTSSASLHENSVWQRLSEKAKEFYSSSPHVQALTCFFIHEIDSLAVLHSCPRFQDAVNMAVHKWNKTSQSEREKYFTSAEMFIKLEEEERRFIQHRQHSVLWENPEVKERSEVGQEIEMMNMSSLFTKHPNTASERENVCQVTGEATDGKKSLKGKPEPNKRMRHSPEVNVMDSDDLTAVRRATSFTNRTKAHQTVRTQMRRDRHKHQ